MNLCILSFFAQCLRVNIRVDQKIEAIFGRFYLYKNIVKFTNDVIIDISKIAILSKCIGVCGKHIVLYYLYSVSVFR